MSELKNESELEGEIDYSYNSSIDQDIDHERCIYLQNNGNENHNTNINTDYNLKEKDLFEKDREEEKKIGESLKEFYQSHLKRMVEFLSQYDHEYVLKEKKEIHRLENDVFNKENIEDVIDNMSINYSILVDEAKELFVVQNILKLFDNKNYKNNKYLHETDTNYILMRYFGELSSIEKNLDEENKYTKIASVCYYELCNQIGEYLLNEEYDENKEEFKQLDELLHKSTEFYDGFINKKQ